MPCPGPFHFSHIADYIYDFCLLPDPDVVFLSLYVMLSILLSILAVRPQVCYVLVWRCPGLCTICHSWQYTGVVPVSLQVDGKVAIEDIPVFGVCRPACHDSSLYLFALVLFLEAVALSQVCIGVNIFYQHIDHVYWGIVYNQHLCICDVHVKTHSPTIIE